MDTVESPKQSHRELIKAPCGFLFLDLHTIIWLIFCFIACPKPEGNLSLAEPVVFTFICQNHYYYWLDMGLFCAPLQIKSSLSLSWKLLAFLALKWLCSSLSSFVIAFLVEVQPSSSLCHTESPASNINCIYKKSTNKLVIITSLGNQNFNLSSLFWTLELLPLEKKCFLFLIK